MAGGTAAALSVYHWEFALAAGCSLFCRLTNGDLAHRPDRLGKEFLAGQEVSADRKGCIQYINR